MSRHVMLVLVTALMLAACESNDRDAPAGAAAPAADGAAAQAAAAAAPESAIAPEGITVVGHGRVSGTRTHCARPWGWQAAREQAFLDARAKAEHYSDLAGAQLGELVSVTETAATPSPPRPMAAAPADEAAADAPPVMAGEQDVGVGVQATWAVQ